MSSEKVVCRLCGSEAEFAFKTKILEKYTISYYECPTCKLLQTEKPYWLDESYQSVINETDTGLILRNLHLRNVVAAILMNFPKDIRCLDFSGGYGVFTRIMRDIGYDFYWHDPFCENILARNFESDKSQHYEFLTAFEALEHYVDIPKELDTIFGISKNVVFSTTLVPEPRPEPQEWWYYGTEHGQHVSLYRKATMEFIAKKYGLFVQSFNNIHFFSEKKIFTPFTYKLLSKLAPYITRITFKRNKSKTFSDMELVKEKLSRLRANKK
jgi:hypothetical protein